MSCLLISLPFHFGFSIFNKFSSDFLLLINILIAHIIVTTEPASFLFCLIEHRISISPIFLLYRNAILTGFEIYVILDYYNNFIFFLFVPLCFRCFSFLLRHFFWLWFFCYRRQSRKKKNAVIVNGIPLFHDNSAAFTIKTLSLLFTTRTICENRNDE